MSVLFDLILVLFLDGFELFQHQGFDVLTSNITRRTRRTQRVSFDVIRTVRTIGRPDKRFRPFHFVLTVRIFIHFHVFLLVRYMLFPEFVRTSENRNKTMQIPAFPFVHSVGIFQGQFPDFENLFRIRFRIESDGIPGHNHVIGEVCFCRKQLLIEVFIVPFCTVCNKTELLHRVRLLGEMLIDLPSSISSQRTASNSKPNR